MCNNTLTLYLANTVLLSYLGKNNTKKSKLFPIQRHNDALPQLTVRIRPAPHSWDSVRRQNRQLFPSKTYTINRHGPPNENYRKLTPFPGLLTIYGRFALVLTKWLDESQERVSFRFILFSFWRFVYGLVMVAEKVRNNESLNVFIQKNYCFMLEFSSSLYMASHLILINQG